MNQFFTSSGQSITASASVLLMNIQDLISFRIDLFNLLSVQGLSRVFSNTTFGEHSSPTLTSGQIDGGKMETVADFIFLGSQITVDGDCSHEIKRHLLLGRKAMTNLAY